MARKPKRIVIRWHKMPDKWGLADTQKRVIWLEPRMDEPTLEEIAIHEVLHVELPDLDEEAVDRTAKSIANVLRRVRNHRDDD